MPKSINAARHAGWIHIIGFVSGVRSSMLFPRLLLMISVQGNNGIPVGSAIMKALTFRGILIGSVKQYGSYFTFYLCYIDYAAGRFEDMNRLITAREIRPVVDKIFPFEQATEAYPYLESQKHVGKVVIKVA